LNRCVEEDYKEHSFRRAVAKEYAEELKKQMQQTEERKTAGRQHHVEQASMHQYPSFAEAP